MFRLIDVSFLSAFDSNSAISTLSLSCDSDYASSTFRALFIDFVRTRTIVCISFYYVSLVGALIESTTRRN